MRNVTLDEEIDSIRTALEEREKSYFPSKKQSLVEQILRALLSWSDTKEKMHENEREHLIGRIARSIDAGISIPVSLTVAHGLRAPSPLKFLNPFGPPTYAWLHNIFAMMNIAKKIERLYDGGVTFWLFEEGLLFHELLDVPIEVVDRNMMIFLKLLERTGLNAKIVYMLAEDIDPDCADQVELSESEIHSVLCSLAWMRDERVIDCLYARGETPYAEIRSLVGEDRWREAERIAREKVRCLSNRKKTFLFEQRISQSCSVDVTDMLIDAAITRKRGRVTIRSTGQALFNHGEAVLDRRGGRLSCHVLPQYRLRGEAVLTEGSRFPISPVLIDPNEFGIEGSPYIWRYESAV